MTQEKENAEDSLLELISKEREKDHELNSILENPANIPKRIEKSTEIKSPIKSREKSDERESETKSKNSGVKIGKKYGLLKCDYQVGNRTTSCKGLIIAKDGQKTGECPKCGRRRKLENTILLYKTNNQKEIRKVRCKVKEYGGLHR